MSHSKMPFSFTLYRTITWLVAPFLPLLLRNRLKAGKEIESRLNERYGKTTIARPQGKLIWFHAASMGELTSILPLISLITAQHPTLAILVTTVTVTSANLAATRLPEGVIHQFAPIDTPQAIHAFLHHWRPSVAYFVDSEFWPNMLLMTQKTGCKLVLLNARISARSFTQWMRHTSIITPMLACYDAIYAKSAVDATRLHNLGASNILEKGNLKFSAPALPFHKHALIEIQSQIGERPVWLAASTHEGEEAYALEAHKQLISQFPNLLTIIIPRHNLRGEAIVSLARNAGLTIARRSLAEIIFPNTACYIADTMGEMGLFYRLSPIVFVGGSLVAHGGQNPFEPARLNCAICYGPHMQNFNEFCEALEQRHATYKINNAVELAQFIQHCLQDPTYQSTLANNAEATVDACQGALQAISEDIHRTIAQLLTLEDSQ